MLSFIFLVVVSGICYGEEEELFDEWVEEGDDFKLGDYKMTAVWTDDSTYITTEGNSVDVPLGECRRMEPFRICFNDTRLVLDGTVVPDTIHSDDVVTEMKIIAYGMLSTLTIERIFEDTTLLINQEEEVVVTISNNDEADATEVLYEEDYPSAILVKSANGCVVDDGTVSWSGILRKGAWHTCTYVIKALKDKRFSSRADLEYYNGMDDKKAYDTQWITVLDYVLDPEITTKSTKLEAGEMTNINIFLKNTYEDTLDVKDFKLIVPPGLKIIERDELNSYNIWRGEIASPGNLSLDLILQAVKTGEHILNLSASYTVEGVKQKITDSKKYTISPDIELELNAEIPQMIPEKENTIQIGIFNPGKKTIHDVKTTVISNLPGFENQQNTFEKLGVRNSQTLVGTTYTPKNTGTYHMNISITYYNEFKERFDIKETQIIVISKPGTVTQSEESQGLNTGINPYGEETIKKKSWLPKISNFSFSFKDSKAGGLWLVLAVVLAAIILLWLRYEVRND